MRWEYSYISCFHFQGQAKFRQLWKSPQTTLSKLNAVNKLGTVLTSITGKCTYVQFWCHCLSFVQSCIIFVGLIHFGTTLNIWCEVHMIGLLTHKNPIILPKAHAHTWMKFNHLRFDKPSFRRHIFDFKIEYNLYNFKILFYSIPQPLTMPW